MMMSQAVAACVLIAVMLVPLSESSEEQKPKPTRSPLARQLSGLRREVHAQTQAQKEIGKQLIAALEDARKERASIRKFIGLYAIVDLLIKSTKLVSVVNPMALAGVHAVDKIKSTALEPLDRRYSTHQNVFATIVAQIVKDHPEWIHRENNHAVAEIPLPKHGKVTVDLLKTDPQQPLPKESQTLKGHGAFELANLAYHMQ